MIDENNVTTSYSYVDPLDRLTLVARAATTPLESWSAFSYPSPTHTEATRSQFTKTDAALRVDTLFDGLGRPKESDQYESANAYIATTTSYDALGRIASTTNASRPLDGLGFATTYTYDALGRTKSVLTPDGATATATYAGNQTTVVDPNLKKRVATTDAFGHLIGVVEDPAGLNLSTAYAYTVLGQLTSVTQGVQVRNFSYDSLGRLLSATNPESGTVNYAYDNNGNLIWRSDARAVETCSSYDTGNRLTAQVYYTGTVAAGSTGQCSSIPAANFYTNTPNVTYAYDSGASNAVGRLVSIASSAATNQITAYDALGRVTGSKQTIGGTPYPFSYTYNLADALISTTYPSGRVVTTGYDGANRPSSLAGIYNGTPTNYVSNLSYAPHGGWASHAYPNQLARSYTYNNRLQPTEMKDTLPSLTNPALDLQYFWGSTVLNGNSTANNGNLTGLNIATQTGAGSPVVQFTQSYGYDGVNRLQNSSDTGGWSEQFGYDRYANVYLSATPTGLPIQTQMPTAASAYDAATNHLVAGAHDPAGNQTVYGGWQMTYDAENRQISAHNSTTTTTVGYTYDGTGERVSKTVASGTTTSYAYVHDAFGNLAAEYTTAGLSPTPPCTTCYLSWDHLGSTRMVTDAGGNIVARHDYLPFGVEIPSGNAGRTSPWATSDNLSAKFTAQEREFDATGLDFFQARYHASGQGRFLSADPAGNAVADPTRPQSWNMYSYVLNNPLNFVDPSGYDCAYLNDTGNGVESVDSNTNMNECTDNGGYWLSGSVNANNITIYNDGTYGFFDSAGNPYDNAGAGLLNNYITGTDTQSDFSTEASAYGQILSKDVAMAQSVGNLFDSYGPIFGFAMKTTFMYETSHTGGVWDFKSKPTPRGGDGLDNFGNCHYGSVGKAIGLPDGFMRWAAGLASWNNYRSKGAMTPTSYGRPWLSIGGGDRPQNQIDITRGQMTGSCTP